MPPRKTNPPSSKAHAAKSLPAISDAEWVVMREFWRLGRGTVADIVQALEGRMHWKPRTVQSLINRLVRKEALSFTKIGREHLYEPRVAEGECVLEASRSFVDRIFGGRLAPLLACFVENGEVTAQEAEQLRKILEQGGRHER
jgi:BlaI family transcriptional regulator, penicillinase repressor